MDTEVVRRGDKDGRRRDKDGRRGDKDGKLGKETEVGFQNALLPV